MRKKIFRLLFILSLFGFVVACGITNDDQEANNDSEPETEDPAEEPVDSEANEEETTELDKEYNFKIANVLAEEDVTSHGINKFVELVSEKSGGKIQMDALHGGQLGSGVETFEAVKNGNLDFAADSYANLASLTSAFEMFHLPFLFESRDQLLSAIGSEKVQERINEEISEIGLKWFSTYEI